ncbi:hypothetical protein FFB58_08360 [Enterobacter sp. MF024]|nr:hypothetical protein FHN83_18070 [Leclercia adecarboxylata]TLU68969.1 hypothetical protein FFB58_08360 [Enterobacter sp. MF024]
MEFFCHRLARAQDCRARIVMLWCGCDQYEACQPQDQKNPVNLGDYQIRTNDHDNPTSRDRRCRRRYGRRRAGAGAGATGV